MTTSIRQTGKKTYRGPALNLKPSILDRMNEKAPFGVWTPVDFLDLGPRDAIDKTLQRLAVAKDIRRIDRGLYDIPRTNQLTGKPTNPDYTAVIDAVARRDQIRVLVDSMTAANQLGLSDAVPSRVVVHTDARIKPIKLGNLTIRFKPTAPSRLYWAGQPAMRVVQALHWLQDTIGADRDSIMKRLKAILDDPDHGPSLRDNLKQGLHTLPSWMQGLTRGLLDKQNGPNHAVGSTGDEERNAVSQRDKTHRNQRRQTKS